MAEHEDGNIVGAGEENAMAQPTSTAPVDHDDKTKKQVDPATTAFVKQWVAKIKSSKKHHEKAFEQMDECMQLAKDGASKEWAGNKDNYVVPILNRLTNQAVAQLYARDPQAYSKRKRRRMFTKWDGQQASLSEAENMISSAQAMIPVQPADPTAIAILADAQQVKQYDTMMDGLADTVTILHKHFIEDSAAQYKQQFKAAVRRTKVCSVAYVKLCFQRLLEKQPDITAKIADATEQLATLQRLQTNAAKPDFDAEGPDAEQLRTLIVDLQSQENLVVAEGPLFAFPRAKSIIIDKACTQLRTLVGAGWIAEEFEKTPDEIIEDYGVDIDGEYTEYKPKAGEGGRESWSEENGTMQPVAAAKVWRVQNRKTGQEFTICEGYPDYIKAPAKPDVCLPRFFDIFPLVFNEIESETDLYPPSDVWLARHLQNEYNRSRQGLREHRLQNRPAYIASKGTFDETDLDKLQTHASGAIIETNTQFAANEKIGDKLMAKPVMDIKPEQYDVKEIYSDILLVTGDQQANVGPTAGATATESSIAEHSRGVGLSDNVDDIDDWLSALTQSTGIAMLRNMSKKTVLEIVGPGAVWPDLELTREEYAEEIILDTKAGSSGRPNEAMDLRNLQTAIPLVVQLPGANPIPFLQKLVTLLVPDAEDAIIEGLPSIAAMNSAAAHPPAPPAAPGAPPASPSAQGPQGAQNAPKPPGVTPPPMPGHPAPQVGGALATGA